MKRTLVICDPETEYTKRLMEFMNRKESFFPKAAAFDALEPAVRYIRENGAEMLLLSEQLLNDEVEQLDVKKIMLLTEEEASGTGKHQTVCKYLPAERILREAESAYDAEMKAAYGSGAVRSCPGRIFAVYSPVGGSGKTSFALTLGLELAKVHRVLYLNMESSSGLETILGAENERSLSDLIYLYRQDPESMVRRFPELTVPVRSLDCVMPAQGFEDLADLHAGEWTAILEQILSGSIYDVILLEPADCMKGFVELLKYCTGILMPFRSDPVSLAKIEGYERRLSDCGAEMITEKTIKVRVPFFHAPGIGRKYYESLPWSELGDCVRRLIRKENIV